MAKRWGFKHLGHEYQREGSVDNYDQIDSIGYLFNPFLKYPKFGHSIATDIASRRIRYGLKSREEIIPFVEECTVNLINAHLKNFVSSQKYLLVNFIRLWKNGTILNYLNKIHTEFGIKNLKLELIHRIRYILYFLS